VGAVVEILRAHKKGNFVACLRQQQQTADDGTLRLDRPWRLAVEKLTRVVAGGVARRFFYRGHRVRSVVVKLEGERGR
jgi:hypothetical protein